MAQNNQNNPNNQNNKLRPRGNMGLIMVLMFVSVGFYFLFNHLSRPPHRVLGSAHELTEIAVREDAKIVNESAKILGGLNQGFVQISGEVHELNAQGQVNRRFTFELNITHADFDTMRNEGISVIVYDEFGNGEVVTVRWEIFLEPTSTNVFLQILTSLLPFILMIGVILFISSKNAGGNNKAFEFGKSRAKIAKNKNVTFKDVAGADEEKEELVEIIDFLKNPKKYEEMGARIPKGILLSGPPGTGKTLLAKAAAGEAHVPFFTISGSDFVEMFVGVGASRVRDLFKNAKASAPCVIFIDEIDAVGRQRGAGMGGGHDEREQTLNQLLVEMDGFGSNLGIIVMAATNRPDVLDPALLRPGRFDRQITINAPDVNGREAILKIHAKNKNIDPSVKFNQLAQRIPGFTGADIENLLNEATLLAARANRKVITMNDLDEATDRVMMGPAKKSKKITDKEKNLIAIHEAGHAVIGLKLDNANIVQKVTIIPRGGAGGYALMLPEEENFLETKKSLTDRITGYLAGRVAEEITFNEVSTGASNDFQMATKIARAMVTEFGMSDLGPVQYEQPQGSIFLGRDYLKDKNFSDQIALEIDKETRKIIEDCYTLAKRVIIENKTLLENIAKYLVKVETLTRADIDEIDQTGTLKRAYQVEDKEENLEETKEGVEVVTEKTSIDDTVELPTNESVEENSSDEDEDEV